MPNPYHDEQGLFTSKEKMGQAIAELRTQATTAPTVEERNAAMDRLLPLQVEYETLTADRVSVSKEWLGRSASSGSMVIPNDPGTMQAYYDGIRETMVTATTDQSDDYVMASKAVELLKRPNLPEGIREDIYTNASDAVKARLVREMGYRNAEQYFTGADVMRLVPKEGPIGPALGSEIASLAGSNAFTFEQRFDIAKRSGNIARLVTYSTPAAAFESAETEAALAKELLAVQYGDVDNQGVTGDAAMEQRRGWQAMAAGARSESTHETILAHYADGDISDENPQADLYNDPAATLLRDNKYLQPKLVQQLFTRLAKENVVRFDQLAGAYVKSHADTSLQYTMSRSGTLEGLSDRLYRQPTAAEIADLQMTAKSLRSTDVERVNAQAQLDGIPANLKPLKREFNQAKKAQRSKKNDPQANARYRELYERVLNGERARFANKVMTYWTSNYPKDAGKA